MQLLLQEKMKMIRKALMLFVLLALSAAPLFAQVGPYVPCVGCDELTYAPYPEPGLWFNPEQSGSGFSLEFQNGIMGGSYYGYDADGESEWYLVTGPLVRSETPGVMWEVEVEPQRFTGGNCLGCPYQAPNDAEKLPPIKIEFLQRAYARLILSDDSIQYMMPFMYGDSGKAFFAEQTPYIFPNFAQINLWTVVFKPYWEEWQEPWKWFSIVLMIGKGLIYTGPGYEGALVYSVWQPVPPPEGGAPFGQIICNLDEALGEPVCNLVAPGPVSDTLNKREYRIPIGNFTDSRFFGETVDGDTVEGFRLQYD